MKAFISWSGGKESALAHYKAMQIQNIEVAGLLNMISEDGTQSRSHGVGSGLLRLQSRSTGIPIVQRRATWQDYEGEYKKAILELKRQGVTAGVFGDIDLEGHRNWVERVCGQMGIEPIFPLWQKKREDILKEFISSGFEAVVVCVKKDLLGPEWLARSIDEDFIDDLRKLRNVDLCGELGEYHTLVISGPIFKKRIEILNARKVKKDDRWFLDILDYELSENI